MKNKKGFTLIELLAIIVILAIIAVITVPIILNIIEKAKKGAAIDSAYGYKEAIGKYYVTELSKNSGFILNGEYIINSDGTISDTNNTYNVLLSGTIPKNGYVNIEKGTVDSGCIQINEYAVTIEDKKVVSAEKGTCQTPGYAGGVSDSNPGTICGNEGIENYDDIDVCYIYSVEDLVEFSNMVNSGKSFQNKTVMVMNDLDIKSTSSYVNANTTDFGDVNADGISETLKQELTKTESNGFKTIGDSTNQFKGLFEGNTHKIKNLYVKNTSVDNIGLFGYNAGTIKGLIIENANIIGNENVGIIAGYNIGNITSTIVSGNISGYSKLGLAVGMAYEGLVETVVEGNITSSFNSEGTAYVGGIIGSNYSCTIKGINKGGTITVQNGEAYKNLGTLGNVHTSTIASSSVTGTITESSLADGETVENGVTIDQGSINNIGAIDNVLDSYIGRDNNNDGYYYDTDSTGNIAIYKLSENPLTITMSGSGTVSDPYLITNNQQLREASYDPSKNYRLDADLDLTNQKATMLSSSENAFTGVFDGNAHTISNTTLKGYAMIGLIGYNEGTVKGLKVNNINIVTNIHGGTVVGYNRGTVTNIIASGNVTGEHDLGLAVGFNASGTIEAVVSGNVSSSFTSENPNNLAHTGGIVGYSYEGTVKGLNIGGTVSAVYGRTYRTVGWIQDATITTGGSETVTVTSTVNGEPGLSNVDGKTYTVQELYQTDPYQEVGLNTSSTSGEYRYALDSNHNPYLIKN